MQELRDHAKPLLDHIVTDMEEPQSPDQKHDKARGARPGNAPQLTQAAKDGEGAFGRFRLVTHERRMAELVSTRQARKH